MEKFNTDLTQVIKWLQNEAPNIQSLVSKKNDWYKKYNDRFWSDWYKNVFNLKTADAFGVYVWCEILGVPKTSFVLDPLKNQWAYGPNRKNYVTTDGGNFYGAGVDTVTGIEEARFALLLRYAALTSDGRIENINRMLCAIFNDGNPWPADSAKYFVCVDASQSSQTGASYDLKFAINDWQGNLPITSSVRTQIGYFNHYISGPLGGPFSSSYTYTGALATTGTYFGGDTQVYAAPNGDMIATGLRFTNNTIPSFVYGNNRMSPNTRYVVSIYIKPDQMADCSFLLRPNVNIVYAGVGKGVANTMGVDEVFTAQSTLVTIKNGAVESVTVSPETVNKGAAFGGGTYTFDTNPALTGFKVYTTGWVRIWAGLETARTGSWTLTQTTQGIQFKTVFQSATAVLKVWGMMTEAIKNANTLPPTESVGRFWITGKSASATVEVNRADYSFDGTVTPPTITFPTNATSPYQSTVPVPTSSFPNGSTLTYTGKFQQYMVVNPVTAAVGDGTTLSYNVPNPPAYQPAFTKPMAMRYITSGFSFSPQFINLLSNRDSGIIPSNAGISYDVIQYI